MTEQDHLPLAPVFGPSKDVRRASQVRRAIRRALQDVLPVRINEGRSQYGIRVPSFSNDLRHVDLALGFLNGQQSCCGEVGCHVPHWSKAWWRRFRKALARHGVEPPRSTITIHVAVFTDPGAQFSVCGPAVAFSMYESTWREPETKR